MRWGPSPPAQTPPPRPPALRGWIGKLPHPGYRLTQTRRPRRSRRARLGRWPCGPDPRRPPRPRASHTRAWIEAQVQLGRNATSLYQELVDDHAFAHHYNSVKRFVAALRRREPERFDVLAFLPGEEAQVDSGQGALTLWKPGQYKRPALFVMTLKYSGKSVRTVVWKTDQQTWARLHEEAFHALGGCPPYVVLDNLKEGVLRPHLYEPELNPAPRPPAQV